MKTVFIISNLSRGGIENYVVQLCQDLYSRNKKSVILCLGGGGEPELVERAKKYAEIITLKEISNNFIMPNRATFNLLFGLNNKNVRRCFTGGEAVVACGSFGLVVAEAIRKLIPTVTVIAGVYHGQEFTWNSNAYHRQIERSLFKERLALGKVHLYGVELSRKLLNVYRVKDSGQPIFPLGINIEPIHDNLGGGTSRRIVILSRFVPFKTFIIQTIENFPSILAMDNKFILDIYGYGEQKNQLLEKIANLRLEKNIFVHGPIELNELNNILTNTFLFMSSGTSLIHSSAKGVPSLTCIDNNNSWTTPGFFSKVDKASYNELYSYAKDELKTIDYCVNELLNTTEAEYAELCDSHKEKATKFDINDNHKNFLKLFERNEKTSQIEFSVIRYAWSFLFSRYSKSFVDRFESLS